MRGFVTPWQIQFVAPLKLRVISIRVVPRTGIASGTKKAPRLEAGVSLVTIAFANCVSLFHPKRLVIVGVVLLKFRLPVLRKTVELLTNHSFKFFEALMQFSNNHPPYLFRSRE